ncbi:MAG: response regulator [Desulfococcaceae bacterium]
MDSKYRILVVDDEPWNLQIMRQILRDRYDAFFATDGQKALELTEKMLPDIILLDIMMPGMDGYRVCELLKSNEVSREIPVLFISSLSDTGDKVKAFEAGGVDYVSKPFQKQEVLARISTHLNSRSLQKRLKEKVAELEEALANIKTLKGLLPICSHCKKIRDDQGYWKQIEVYIQNHSDALFSHSICPDCIEEIYSKEEWYKQ